MTVCIWCTYGKGLRTGINCYKCCDH